MQKEADEIQMSYFALCDQVIVEAQTGKHSLIGIYSALAIDHLPVQINVAVAFGARVQTARPREFLLRVNGPDNDVVLTTPPVPYDQNAIAFNLQRFNLAALHFAVNITGMPLNKPGMYTTSLTCDGDLLATYPLFVNLRG